MENDYDREDAEFEREKEEGYYQPSKNAEDASTTRDKGNMAIGAIYALMGSIVAFVIAGYLLDRFLETSPWFIVSGVLLGTIIGFYQFIRISGKNN
jgi:F0F1-type ATP synthase assembly protein I